MSWVEFLRRSRPGPCTIADCWLIIENKLGRRQCSSSKELCVKRLVERLDAAGASATNGPCAERLVLFRAGLPVAVPALDGKGEKFEWVSLFTMKLAWPRLIWCLYLRTISGPKSTGDAECCLCGFRLLYCKRADLSLRPPQRAEMPFHCERVRRENNNNKGKGVGDCLLIVCVHLLCCVLQTTCVKLPAGRSGLVFASGRACSSNADPRNSTARGQNFYF